MRDLEYWYKGYAGDKVRITTMYAGEAIYETTVTLLKDREVSFDMEGAGLVGAEVNGRLAGVSATGEIVLVGVEK